MSEERKRILNMLAEGKINAEEAEKLLAAAEEVTEDLNKEKSGSITDGKFLYVKVEPKEGAKAERVSVKVPFALLKAGLNIAGLIPDEAKEKINSSMSEKGLSFDLSNMSKENIQEMMTALETLTVDIDTEETTVQVYCR